MTQLLTSYGGTIHLPHCRHLTENAWPWDPRLDGPGVAKPCAVCLPGGLPSTEGES